jgi:hypothetical protein
VIHHRGISILDDEHRVPTCQPAATAWRHPCVHPHAALIHRCPWTILEAKTPYSSLLFFTYRSTYSACRCAGPLLCDRAATDASCLGHCRPGPDESVTSPSSLCRCCRAGGVPYTMRRAVSSFTGTSSTTATSGHPPTMPLPPRAMRRSTATF